VSSKAATLQLVAGLGRERTYPDGVEVRDAARWLAKLDCGRR
jgi:hypothetical protein